LTLTNIDLTSQPIIGFAIVPTITSGSRYSAMGGQLNMFPSTSHLFLRWRVVKVYSQIGWGDGRICPNSNPPVSATAYHMAPYKLSLELAFQGISF